MEHKNGTEYIDGHTYNEVPMQGLPWPQDFSVSMKINLKWSLRDVKKKDIINFQFRFALYLTKNKDSGPCQLLNHRYSYFSVLYTLVLSNGSDCRLSQYSASCPAVKSVEVLS